MATKITTSRQFRKGRFLHGEAGDFALVYSPAPRMWTGISIRRDDGSVKIDRLASEFLRKNYTEFSSGVSTTPLDKDKIDNLVNTLRDTWEVPMPWAIRSGLRYRSTSEWSTPAVSSVITAREKIDAIKRELEAARMKPDVDDLVTALGGTPTEKVAAAPRKRASTFTVPTLPEDAYWYESDEDRKLTRDYISLRQAGFTVNLMIAGPSGSGKTVGVEKLGAELGIPVHIVNCQAITTPEKWIGQMMADPEKGTYFVPSQHIQWVEGTAPECEGYDNCILLYDEITRLRPELNNMTYSLFDTQRGLEVPQMGRRVLMNPKNLVISTANIGAAFSGTFGQDRAFRERFAMTLERDFPPPNEEVKIITSATGISPEDAKMLVKVAGATRNLWREQTIEQPISTRTLVTWSLLVAGGYDVMQAAEYTVLPLYSEDGGVESDRAKVRLQIEGKVA